jgi:hypothetical protein
LWHTKIITIDIYYDNIFLVKEVQNKYTN